MAKKKNLSVYVKVPLEEPTTKFKFVRRGSIQRVTFPKDLVEKTMDRNKPMFKNKIYFVKPRLLLHHKIGIRSIHTMKKLRVLDSIRIAARNYQCFPLNQTEYIKLLWKLFDEITDLVEYIKPIILSSPNNNLIHYLYMIFVQIKKAIIKLVEYDAKPISKKLFQDVCFKLTDNLLTCNRIILACCYVQNSYMTVNKSLQKLIIIELYLEAVVVFVSTVILQSTEQVKNYIPSGYIIRRLRCSRCVKIVSLSGCTCTNWELDALTPEHKKIFTNANIEDGPTNSKMKYIKSWKIALKQLQSMPSPSETRLLPKFRQETDFSVRPLQIGEPLENKTSLKRKAGETIDEVRLTKQVINFLNEWKYNHEGDEMIHEIPMLQLDIPAIKRKAIDYDDQIEDIMDLLTGITDLSDLEALLAESDSDED